MKIFIGALAVLLVLLFFVLSFTLTVILYSTIRDDLLDIREDWKSGKIGKRRNKKQGKYPINHLKREPGSFFGGKNEANFQYTILIL